MEFKSYTVKVKTPPQWEEFHNTLLSSSSVNHIPDREVTCSDDKKHSPTRGTYLLTDDEANDLREHHFVDWIELCPTCYPELYPKPKGAARRFKRNIKVYRDLDANPPKPPLGYSSINFDPTDPEDDGLSIPYDSSLSIGSSDFTFETFFKYFGTATDVSNNGPYTIFHLGNNQNLYLRLSATGGNVVFEVRYTAGSSNNYFTTTSITSSTWHHVALVKESSTLKVFFNGTEIDSRSVGTFNSYNGPFTIGVSGSNTLYFDGRLSSLRFVIGTALYTSNFTPPTLPLTNIENTRILTCISDPDFEATGREITLIGSPELSTDSPAFEDQKYPYISDTVTPEVIRTNWGVQRVGLATNGDFWTGTGNLAPEFTDIGYNMTGKNVDIIIQDSGVLQYHPEFMDGKGQSRVRDIVLDGPLYLDPTSSYLQANTYTKADGRIGIATAAAHNWWNNNSSGYRSADFDTGGSKNFGTIAVSSTYVVDNTLGASLDGTSGITNGHGTACAGLAAGKTMGTAFEANIWNMSGIGEPPSLSITIEQNYDLMKVFHKYKPVNSKTGVKNPTVVNGSWGYYSAFVTVGNGSSFTFRGTTSTYTGTVNGSGNVLLGRAMCSGFRGNEHGAEPGAAINVPGDEFIAEGPIYVSSAGNYNQKLGLGADDPDRLNTVNNVACSHRDFTHPQGIGFDSTNDYHPTICVGAMDDEVEINYEERKAEYSNNGPGVDVWAPADETLAPGTNGVSTYEDFRRSDDTRFYDCRFGGTSAAAPVATGVIALYLQSNPRATQKQTKKWLNRYGSKIGSPYRDDETDDQTTSYWTGSYNMRGAEKRILFNPYYTDSTQPQQAQLITSGVSFSGISISLK